MRPDPVAAPRLPAYRALAVTVVTLALAYGVWYAYSVFLVALLREFGWSRSVLAGAFSVFTLVSGGAGPVLGALADRFGPRRLILIGGVLLAASLWADSFVTRALHLYRGRRGGRLLARGSARERVVPLHRDRGVSRQHLQPDPARAPGRVLRRSRAARHDRGLGDQRGGRGQHPGQDRRRLRVGSLPARGGLRAWDGGDDRGCRRAVAGRGRAVGLACPRLRCAVRARLLGHRFRGAGHDERPVPGAELRGDLQGDPGGERARQRAGAWLAGRIFDATGSYAIAFSIAAAAAAVAALSVWGSRLPRPEGG